MAKSNKLTKLETDVLAEARRILARHKQAVWGTDLAGLFTGPQSNRRRQATRALRRLVQKGAMVFMGGYRLSHGMTPAKDYTREEE